MASTPESVVDFPRFGRQSAASLRRLKGVGTEAAEMGMAAGGIVKYLNVSEDIGSCQVASFVDAFFDALLF